MKTTSRIGLMSTKKGSIMKRNKQSMIQSTKKSITIMGFQPSRQKIPNKIRISI